MNPKKFINKYKNNPFYCVYRLISIRGVVIYVGSSSFPSSRIYSHLKSDLDFHSVEFDAFDNDGELAENEARQIVKYNPLRNVVLPTSSEFVTLKNAQDNLSKEIRRIVRDLPYEFCRGTTQYVSSVNFDELKDKILDKARDTLDNMHKKECNQDVQ